eukprot:UN03361
MFFFFPVFLILIKYFFWELFFAFLRVVPRFFRSRVVFFYEETALTSFFKMNGE